MIYLSWLEPVEPPRTTIYATLNVYIQYKQLICHGSNQSNYLKLLQKPHQMYVLNRSD